MKTLIIIPARYGSTRLPGKPLLKIAGETMLSRVVSLAKKAMLGNPNIELAVATDDTRIMAHCDTLNVASVMTPVNCETGTDRALAAMHALNQRPDFVINLQGDMPLMPPAFVKALLDEITEAPDTAMLTPVIQLSWQALDTLRDNKKTTPFSGTCAILNHENNAIWFSKNIIPAIRKESALREHTPYSPVFRHIGLYAYSRELLEQYVTWPVGHYEALEGLEQLRVLEQGYPIRCVKVSSDYPLPTGVDSPEDLKRVEALIKTHGSIV